MNGDANNQDKRNGGYSGVSYGLRKYHINPEVSKTSG